MSGFSDNLENFAYNLGERFTVLVQISTQFAVQIWLGVKWEVEKDNSVRLLSKVIMKI